MTNHRVTSKEFLFEPYRHIDIDRASILFDVDIDAFSMPRSRYRTRYRILRAT